MFPNLNAEMARAKLTIKGLSRITNINYETLKLKFRGNRRTRTQEQLGGEKI